MALSERERKRRQNIGVFVSGQTGAGKSRMLERLAQDWTRVLYVDPTNSFGSPDDKTFTITRTYEETVTALSQHYQKGPFRIVAVYKNDEEYAKLFTGLARLLDESKGLAEPWLLLVDEVDLFSEPSWIDPNLRHMLRYGRHSAMSWICACRADVETHRAVRMNATFILFRQGMLSPDARRSLKDAEEIREAELPKVGKLTLHGAEEPPEAVEGTHFLCVPVGFDELLVRWRELANGS